MKEPFKIYITKEDRKKILAKAESVGIVGRGALSKFLSKVANEPVVFVDANLQTLLKATLSPSS